MEIEEFGPKTQATCKHGASLPWVCAKCPDRGGAPSQNPVQVLTIVAHDSGKCTIVEMNWPNLVQWSSFIPQAASNSFGPRRRCSRTTSRAFGSISSASGSRELLLQSFLGPFTTLSESNLTSSRSTPAAEKARMEDQRFDKLAKSIASGSRRSFLSSVVAAALGTAFGAAGWRAADAAQILRGPGEICRKPGDCANGFCRPADRTGRRYCGCTQSSDCPQLHAGDQCHGAVCTQGACGLVVLEGSACDDANACTASSTCDALGQCVGTPIECTPLDECHDPGTCDPQSGQCSNPAKADRTPCSIGVCVAGTCEECTANGDNCTQSSECCTQNCFNFVCAPLVSSCETTTCSPPAFGCAGTTCCGSPAFFTCGDFCCGPPATQCCNGGTTCCAPS
jgi:hypothetical protein